MDVERASQRDALWASLLATLGLLLLAHADVGFGDSGELSTAAVTLGVAHPTGFAVDLLWLKLASLVPIGHVALRLNAATAMTGGLSIGLVVALTGLLIARVGLTGARERRIGVLCGVAAMCGFSTFLLSARAVEVYSLALLVVLGAAYCALLGGRASRATPLLLGLGLGLHITVLAYVGLIVLAQLALERNRARFVLTGIVPALCGALVVCYLPLASLRDPPIDWGDPETPSGLLHHLSAERIRSAYATDMFGGAHDAPVMLVRQLKPFSALVLLAPLALALRARRRHSSGVPPASSRTRAAILGLTLLGLLDAAYAVWVNPMGVVDRQVGHVAGACAAVLGGLSVAMLLAQLTLRPAMRRLALGSTFVLCVAQTSFAFDHEVEDDFALSELYGSGGLITRLPPRALFVCTSDDACSASLFALHAEHVRPDLDTAPAQHLWDATVVRRLEGVRLAATRERAARRAYADNAVRALLEASARGEGRPLVLESPAIARSVQYRGSLAPLAGSMFASTGVVTFDSYDRAGRFMGDRHEDRFRRGTAAGARARAIWSRAFSDFGELGLGEDTLVLAIVALSRATMVSPERPAGWTNFGVALLRMGRYADAQHATQRAIHLAPTRPTAWVNLVRLHARLGDPNTARAVLQRADAAGVRDPRLNALREELRAP